MVIGTLALTGFPLTAGYFSKDAIIEAAISGHNPFAIYGFAMTVIAAAMTAFYSWRLIYKTFHGAPHDQQHYEAAHESPIWMLIPIGVLAAGWDDIANPATLIVSGIVLSAFGPQWWHVSSAGRFINSLHFWAVQLFFIFMVLHLWGQYWGAGWRDGRAPTWMVGVVIFLVSIVTAFTGYISQQNLDAQWIAVNAKDAINSTGVGAFFNPLNFGQMYGLHVMLLPIGVTLLVVLHVIQVRLRGVVAPLGATQADVAEGGGPGEARA